MKENKNTKYTTYLDKDGEFFTVEDSESYYMDEDEMYDASNSFQNTLEDISTELRDLVYLWIGHANFKWSTLTPEYLFELNARCSYIKKSIRLFLEDAYRVLGTRGSDHYAMTAADYEDSLYCNHEFELNLMQVIQKSYEFSSGKSQGIDGIIDLEWFEQKYAGKWQLRLLRPITVRPWSLPETPALVVPERPRVILTVLSVSDSAPRISVGFDDIFCNEPIGREILVDDDVRVGDRVIIKTSGWEGLGYELQNPEYDGLAESDCPCSEMTEVMEAEYTFNLEFEQERHEGNWRHNWMEKHFTLRSEHDIRSSGKTTYNGYTDPIKVVPIKGIVDDDGWEEYVEYEEEYK